MGGSAVEGRGPVLEAIKGGRQIDKLFIVRGETDRAILRIVSLARQAGAAVSEVDRRKLDKMSVTHSHQGVIAVIPAREYVSLQELISEAQRRETPPFLIVCDGIEDPHNLGAIIRTAEVTGACGVIIPKHRSVGLTASVSRASAGALEHMPVSRVGSMASALRELKDGGFWLFAADMEGGTPLYSADFQRACAIVIGSEGEGVSRLVKEACDYVVSLPMFGKTGSLNASNAAAVIMYELIRQRISSTKVQ